MSRKLLGSNLGKVLGTLLVVGMAGSTVSYGTFASFTAQTSSTGNTFSTGTLTLTGSTASTTSFTTSNLKPGDSVPRYISIVNPAGNINATLELGVHSEAGTPTVLSTNTTNGLRYKIDECSQAWAGSPLACGGTTTANVIADRAIVTATTSLGAINAGATRHFLVTPSLPTAADNTFQGKSEAFTFAFIATQVSGEVR